MGVEREQSERGRREGCHAPRPACPAIFPTVCAFQWDYFGHVSSAFRKWSEGLGCRMITHTETVSKLILVRFVDSSLHRRPAWFSFRGHSSLLTSQVLEWRSDVSGALRSLDQSILHVSPTICGPSRDRSPLPGTCPKISYIIFKNYGREMRNNAK